MDKLSNLGSEQELDVVSEMGFIMPSSILLRRAKSRANPNKGNGDGIDSTTPTHPGKELECQPEMNCTLNKWQFTFCFPSLWVVLFCFCWQ